ncbi:MAG: hypothetical protein ACK4JA_01055 [Parazoarcus communis]
MLLVQKFKGSLPWWLKIGTKILLSRLPAGYSFWQNFRLFRHGHMDSIDYALGVFGSHVDRAWRRIELKGSTILELGPGDSVATALIAKVHGARSVLVDAGSFATKDLSLYRRFAEDLESRGYVVPLDVKRASSFDDFLVACECSYLTDGLESLKKIPSASIDFVFSQAVLEHVRLSDFLDTQRELFRLVNSFGVCSHRVDLRDHLGGALNNLRFSRETWESDFFARSGFYTNRIQMDRMLHIFREAGFGLSVTEVRRWERLPTLRSNMAQPFCDMDESELNVSGFDVVLRRGNVR